MLRLSAPTSKSEHELCAGQHNIPCDSGDPVGWTYKVECLVAQVSSLNLVSLGDSGDLRPSKLLARSQFS